MLRVKQRRKMPLDGRDGFSFSPTSPLKRPAFVAMCKSLRIKFAQQNESIHGEISRRHDLFARVAKVKLLSRTRERIRWCRSCVKEQETCLCYFTDGSGKTPLAAANPRVPKRDPRTRKRSREEVTVLFGENTMPSKDLYVATEQKKKKRLLISKYHHFPPNFHHQIFHLLHSKKKRSLLNLMIFYLQK